MGGGIVYNICSLCLSFSFFFSLSLHVYVRMPNASQDKTLLSVTYNSANS